MGLFFVYFRLFKQTLHCLQQMCVKKCPSCIRSWDSNPQPLEHESPPIATWPGLPPLLGLFVPAIKGYKTKRSHNYGLILFIGLSLRLSWIDWLHRTANYAAVVPRPSCIFTSCSFRLVCILTLCNVIWRWAFVSRKFRCPILHN